MPKRIEHKKYPIELTSNEIYLLLLGLILMKKERYDDLTAKRIGKLMIKLNEIKKTKYKSS